MDTFLSDKNTCRKLLFETRPAQYRPTLSRKERDRSHLRTYRTNRFGFRASLGFSSFSRSAASLTTPGIVRELLFKKEQLFVGGENKIGAAVFAWQNPIYENVGLEHARRPSEKRIYVCFNDQLHLPKQKGRPVSA